jgi:protein TonB
MNTKKQYPNDKLQKSSLLFLQLGLVLALFIVYHTLEIKTLKKPYIFANHEPLEPDIFIESIPIYSTESNEETKPKVKKQVLLEVIKTKSHHKLSETIFDPIAPRTKNIEQKINSLPDGDSLDPEPDEIIDFKKLEDAPIFAGCEGLEKEESKKCFTKGISNFINKRFNTSVADNLIGKQKIWVQFKVDKYGEIVDIKARSLHKSLEKEAIRVIEKIPAMTPGKQRKRPVSVKYTLPIALIVN